MKRFKKASIIFWMFMLLSVVAMPVSASAAKLNKTSISLNVGKTYTLKAAGTTGKITWTSNNKSVATVSSKGVVTAKKKGTAVITAKYGKKKLTCKITVKPTITKTKKTIALSSSNVSRYLKPKRIVKYDTFGEIEYINYRLQYSDSDWYVIDVSKDFGLKLNYKWSHPYYNDINDINDMPWDTTVIGANRDNISMHYNYHKFDNFSALKMHVQFTKAKGKITVIHKSEIAKISHNGDKLLLKDGTSVYVPTIFWSKI